MEETGGPATPPIHRQPSGWRLNPATARARGLIRRQGHPAIALEGGVAS